MLDWTACNLWLYRDKRTQVCVSEADTWLLVVGWWLGFCSNTIFNPDTHRHVCGSHENDEAWGVTKVSQHLDNPNCCKSVRKMRGRDRLCLWERGTAEHSPRAHGLTLTWVESLISTENSHKLCKHSQASVRRCVQNYASPLPHSHRGMRPCKVHLHSSSLQGQFLMFICWLECFLI